MAYKKESLEKLLLLIDEICNEGENIWFKNELRRKFSNNESDISLIYNRIQDVKNDTLKIKKLLNFSPEIKIDYSYIKHQLLIKRLEADYLRMENVRYDLSEKDEVKRLYDYCVNAFYQIENLINYYYHEKFPNIIDLLNHLEKVPNIVFKRKEERNVGDIIISTKILAFSNTYYSFDNKDFTGFNIDNLRQIRNEGVHRCTRIKTLENENPRLHKFIKYATFDSIHSLVDVLNKKIKDTI